MSKALSLKGIMSDLKFDASKNPGFTYKRGLKHGLTVYVRVDEGLMMVGCSREGKWPGNDEMMTVLRDANSPSDVRQLDKWKCNHTERREGIEPIYFIWAKWLMPAELFEVPQVTVRAVAYE